MLVNLYVNWGSGTILNEEQARETVEDKYYLNTISDDSFNDWLSKNYTHLGLFNISENEKEVIHADFMEEMEGIAWEEFAADGYEEVSMEI